MENNDLISSNLHIDYQAKAYLNEAAKWAKFLAIVGFIFCGLFALLALMIMIGGASIINNIPGGAATFGAVGIGFIGFLYLIGAAIGFIMAVIMYRFASRTLTALATDDQTSLNGGLSSLRMLFRIYGIFMIIYLAIIVVVFLIGIVGILART